MHLQECQDSVCIATELSMCLHHRPFWCPGQALHGGCSSCSSQDLGRMILHGLRSDRYRSSKVLNKQGPKGETTCPYKAYGLLKLNICALPSELKQPH